MSFTFLSGPDYLALPSEQPWIIKKLIPVGGLINLYGKPKAGKSFAALGLAAAVANNEASWMGFDVMQTGRVAYLQVDTPRSAWALRLNEIKAAGYNLNNIFFADRELAPYPFNILDPEHQAWIAKMTQQVKPLMIIFDTLRDIHEQDEDKSGPMKQVITAIDAACGQGIAKVLVSHSRKDNPNLTDDDNIMDGNRGSSAVPAKMDTVMRLTEKYLCYDGRSVERGKQKVVRDKATGMVLMDGTEDAILHSGKIVLKTMAGESMSAMARELARLTGAGERTCRRRLVEMTGIKEAA